MVGRNDSARRGRDLRWLAVFRVLATTSSSCARFVGDCVLVWAAYAVPCVLAEYPGSWFCYRSLMRGGVWAAGCVAWFYVLVALNFKLFSAPPRTRLGPRPRPPTRAVSSIRSPRNNGVGPELTFFPSMPTAAPRRPVWKCPSPTGWRLFSAPASNRDVLCSTCGRRRTSRRRHADCSWPTPL